MMEVSSLSFLYEALGSETQGYNNSGGSSIVLSIILGILVIESIGLGVHFLSKKKSHVLV